MDNYFYKILLQKYSAIQVLGFDNRYLGYNQLQNYLEKNVFPYYSYRTIGESELRKSIYEITIGHGDTKILIWSQMHGNESTTTKAILDLLNYIHLNPDEDNVKGLLERCSIKIIPMLNPDGASDYNRLNANKKDLNRDAIEQSQSETLAFFRVLNQFKPDYCFNMHGQRTMFSAGKQECPATLSFLSPSVNKERSLNTARKVAMRLISSAYMALQQFIPLQVGRYDDTYNPNCFGDYIQSRGIPTVLFEAGHYPGDYHRNKTRQLVFLSLHHMLGVISQNKFAAFDFQNYFKIPMNQKLFYDCIIHNSSNTYPDAIGISYDEVLKDNKVVFLPIIKNIANLDSFYAFKYVDAKRQNILTGTNEQLKLGRQLDKIQVDENIITLKF